MNHFSNNFGTLTTDTNISNPTLKTPNRTEKVLIPFNGGDRPSLSRLEIPDRTDSMSSVRPVTYTLNRTQAVRTGRLRWIQMGPRVGGRKGRGKDTVEIRRPGPSENRVVCYAAEECEDRRKNRRSGKLRSPHQTWWPCRPNVEVTWYSVCVCLCVSPRKCRSHAAQAAVGWFTAAILRSVTESHGKKEPSTRSAIVKSIGPLSVP